MSDDDMTEDTENTENTEDVSADDDWAAAMQEQEVSENQESENQENADSLGFEEFDNDPTAGKAISPELDLILDIPVTISMEVGSTSITIRNLLQLNQGSVIELDRLAGEPLNVLVNGTLIAHGEVVVVNEKFGIRMTDVISPAERIKKLS
ncbi:Flagellar motor switch protein FliN [gamma proteobacterium IMCC1989]|nr:Flagellar motor switch protein FliN [gamma proteobacterium IMCC1989]